MDLNAKLFFKINGLVGKSKILDAFSRAGAEWVIIAMFGWYISSSLIYSLPDQRRAFWNLIFLMLAWCLGWLINLFLGLTVQEPRPYITYPQSKTLLKPLMSWKSFPSDHSMSSFVIFFMAMALDVPGSWALLPMAFWVIWGRVYSGLHYPLDVIGGFFVAILSSVIMNYFYNFVM